MSEGDEFSRRWSSPSFVEAAAGLLGRLVTKKAVISNADLRGIVVGLDGAVPALLYGDLLDVEFREVDASFGKFACPFSNGVFKDCRFNSAIFDTCLFKNAKFYGCSFENAQFGSPFLNDAHFVECSFLRTIMGARGYKEYGGRRVYFEQCGFQESRLENLQLRATKFIDCEFDGAKFEGCLLAGVTVTGTGLTGKQLVDCEVSQTTINNVRPLPP